MACRSGEVYRRIGTVSLRLLLLEDRGFGHIGRLVPCLRPRMKSLHRMWYHVRPGCGERIENAETMNYSSCDRECVDWWTEAGIQHMYHSGVVRGANASISRDLPGIRSERETELASASEHRAMGHKSKLKRYQPHRKLPWNGRLDGRIEEHVDFRHFRSARSFLDLERGG